MSAEPERRVVLDANAVELRRRLGTTAWVVFEELQLLSTGPIEDCRATVSVRSLAVRLGLAKDTVARALGRLRRAGLVTASQSRTTTGVFASGSYQLTVPTAIIVDDTRSRRTSRLPNRSRTSRSTGSQLTLALDP